MSDVLIIGNGLAAHRLVERLRQHGHQGTLTVLGAEKRPAYNRALLTSVLRRTLHPEAVTLPDLPAGTQIRLGVIATGIDRDRCLVHADDQVGYHYDELVLATGARPQIPDLPGVLTADGHLANGVTTLRTRADCERISEGAVVVLGGGVLGVEAALGLLGSGHRVTLVHPHDYPMDRHLDAPGGRLLADHLNKLGMSMQLGRKAVEYTLGKLFLDDGRVLETDTLLLCTGVTPEAELARDVGLAVRRGVVVDDRLRTNDPHIHAIGDCAEYAGNVPGLLDPAWDQAETLAKLLTGGHARYRGTRLITRLKAPSIDVASLGSLEDLTNPDAKVELVTLSDRTCGRYAKLALCDQRITGAVLLGFPQAIASISQLYDRSLPVPSDRLRLLLGTAAVRTAPVALPDEAVICRCNNVTKKALVRAWRGGAREILELAEATRATTGCGSCVPDVRRICDSFQSTAESEMVGPDSSP